MSKRLNDLTIGQTIFVLTTVVVGVILLLSSFLTYRLIFIRTDTLIETTSKEINKQVILNYENYLSNVIDLSNSLQKYIIDQTKTDDLDTLQELFETTTAIQRNIVNIALFTHLGQPIISSQQDMLKTDYSSYDWFKQANTFKDIHHFSKPHTEDLIIGGVKDVFTISKSVEYIDKGQNASGVLMIDIDTSEFRSLATKTNLGENGHIIIMDPASDIVYSSLPACFSESCISAQIAKSIILGGDLQKIDGQSMYVNVNTIKDTRWKIATFINVNDIAQAKSQTFIRMSMIFFGTLIVLAIASAIISRRINDPMNKLKKYIQKIESGDFDSHVHVEGQKEVVVLSEAFNNMSDRIKELMQKVLNEQNEKRKTHFKALQNQINPHFLYNTLDSIVWLSENNRNADVEKAIIALSKFFRMSISSESNIVALKDEIEHVSNYLLIQQIRYQNAFVFDIDIDPRLLDRPVLKLSLQPLVENAIIHGIQPHEEFSKIGIRGIYDPENTIIEVFNQGYGITQERIDQIRRMLKSEMESSSMGLKNVYQRLKLYYGEQADLIIESKLDEYTKVIMKIPFVKEMTP